MLSAVTALDGVHVRSKSRTCSRLAPSITGRCSTDWPKDRRLTWTLTTFGKTSQAKAWLQPEWQVDEDLIARDGRYWKA